MKLLFIENRYKTYTFEAIANSLQKDGHDITFIVQNKLFKPKSKFNICEIKYPSKKQLNNTYNADKAIEEIIASDRMQNFFQKKGKAYFYYYNSKIGEILDAVNPDFVFGESTAFHELLTIKNCKEKNILYLNPSSCRYPKNRFSFYTYNTLTPYKGSGELLTDKEASNIVNSIVNRSAKPDYMKVVKKQRLKTLKDKTKKVVSYLSGDTYNTPSPVVKYSIEKQKEENIIQWDAFAKAHLPSDTFLVLYPLQMQPEANIDVWGFKHRNQLQLIKDLVKYLPAQVKLVVKPNPKSKYEMSEELVSYVKNNDSIIALQHAVSMDDVIGAIDLVVTVTGTIAIESILSNKPVATLINTLNNKQNNCVYVNDLQEIPELIDAIRKNTFPKIKDQEKLDYINTLNSTSYHGRFSDPFSFAGTIEGENFKSLVMAFKNVIKD